MLYVPFYLQQFYSWFYHEWNGNGFKRMEVRNEKSEDKRQCQVEIRLCLRGIYELRQLVNKFLLTWIIEVFSETSDFLLLTSEKQIYPLI